MTPLARSPLCSICCFILLTTLSGCRAFDVELNSTYGFGAVVKVPAVLHVGLGGGLSDHRMGHFYDRGWIWGKGGTWGAIGPFHWNNEYGTVSTGMARPRREHFCVGLLPFLFDDNMGNTRDVYSLEVNACALAFEVRLGFNPVLAWEALTSWGNTEERLSE